MEFVSTGNFALNYIISGKTTGGVPISRITQFIGDSSVGKSAFVTTTMSEAQKKGYITIFYDAENTVSADFAATLGLDPELLIYRNPETIEDCFDQVEKDIVAIRTEDQDTPIVIGIDSLPVLCAQKELEKETPDVDNMVGAMRAKLLGAKLRRINPIVAKNNVAMMVVNQHRLKVGVMFGNPETMGAGGKSLEYYLSTNIRVAKSKVIKDDNDNPVGIEGSVETKKNKCFRPFMKTPFTLRYDEGLNPYVGLFELLLMQGIITSPSKGWYQYKDLKFRKKEFQDNPEEDRFKEMICDLDIRTS